MDTLQNAIEMIHSTRNHEDFQVKTKNVRQWKIMDDVQTKNSYGEKSI